MKTTLILGSALLLAACQSGAPAAPVTFEPARQVIADIRAWTPGIRWSEPERAMFGFPIYGAGSTSLPAETVAGVRMRGSEWDAAWFDELNAAALQDGWTPYSSLSVDSTTSARWGYVKTLNDESRFLIFSSLGMDCVNATIETLKCARHETEVFYTGAVTKGQLQLKE